jgi:hypothetical protein
LLLLLLLLLLLPGGSHISVAGLSQLRSLALPYISGKALPGATAALLHQVRGRWVHFAIAAAAAATKASSSVVL